jgi:uncharacterized repeat protein (TIGR03803 family)
MRFPIGFFIVPALVCGLTISSSAQTFRTLASFNGTNGGSPDMMSLIQSRDGSLYGTTEQGGIDDCEMVVGCGTIFKITQDDQLISLYQFCSQPNCRDGDRPVGGLLIDEDGYFYGATVEGGNEGCLGGCGTIFRISPLGKLNTLYSFCPPGLCPGDGSSPEAALVQGIDGNLYGAADSGGNGTCTDGCGTIFRINLPDKLTMLYSFCSQPNCTDGKNPNGLVQASDGNFYGTTKGGGTGPGGTVFRISPTGTEKTLYNFCSQRNCTDGWAPEAGLVQGIDGNFYGTTTSGGTHVLDGTVFKITPSGTLTTLYSFCSLPNCEDGSGPIAGLIQATDGNFYGTTSRGGNPTCAAPYGCGTVFQISPEGVLTTLHKFDLSDGAEPLGGLLQATNGNIYGTTWSNGPEPTDVGTVFSLSMGLSPFVTFVQAAGKVGQTGGILGQGFTGTSSVSLNGTPATFTVESDTFLEATVPAGATTGYVTVTTPSGTLTSNVPFHVIP